MTREEEIRIIAHDIWEKEGCCDGRDVEQWLRAEVIWKQRRRRKIRKRIFFSLIIALLFGLVLVYEWRLGSLEISHVYLMAIIYILAMLFWHVGKLREWWRWIVDFAGLEKSGIFQLWTGLFGGLLISIYLLLSGKNDVIPPVLQFSIVPVTATLGGLVIAGANYSKISPERRSELLRVAQSLIVATISLIFFAVLFYFADIGGSVNPNNLPSTQLEWIKLVFFWLAVVCFFSGTSLFVVGIINLAVGLKNLKKENK